MTLNDLECPFALKSVSGSATNKLAFWLSDKTVRKFEELPIYCQQQNCSVGILVSSKVRFMWIFAGVCKSGGIKLEWGGRKWRFSLLSLAISSQPSYSRPQFYIVLCSPLVALYWRRNGWPWMTLNGHFVLKSGPSSSYNGLAFWLSEKTVRKFAELRIYSDTVRGKKCSPARDCTGEIRVIHGVIQWNKRTGSVKPVNCIYTYRLTLLTHAVHWCL